MVHYSWVFYIINNNRFGSRNLSCILSFIISACKSFEGKIYQFFFCSCFKKRIGSVSIYYFCGSDNCFGCHHESNELFALNRSWFFKRSANSNTIEKHYSKEYLCIV